MFSQFRSAVEHLAQQPRRSESQDSASPTPTSQHERSSSTDSQPILPPLSSAQLAESAINNIRKSLATQRSASPKAVTSPDPFKPRSKLEERLRASLSFTVGEASNSTTPNPSTRVTPVPPLKD